jgi:uncharacterized protein
VRALSLAVAERCNLGCTYCYADGGSFGGRPKNMPREIAEASVRRLLADVGPGERVNLAFLGGEPLANRDVIRRATELAARIAGEKGTKNRLDHDERHAPDCGRRRGFRTLRIFAVTVSLDGVGETHDRLRPTRAPRQPMTALSPT